MNGRNLAGPESFELGRRGVHVLGNPQDLDESLGVRDPDLFSALALQSEGHSRQAVPLLIEDGGIEVGLALRQAGGFLPRRGEGPERAEGPEKRDSDRSGHSGHLLVPRVSDTKSTILFILEPRPAAEVSPTAAEPRPCLNCGEPLRGPYCWKCGQEEIDLHRPLKQLARDAVGDLLNLDTRFLRTLGPLLFCPGLLIREYLAGRRVSFVPPLKMYLLATLIFFGLVAVLPRKQFTVVRTTETTPEAMTPGGVRFQLPTIDDQSSWFAQRIEEASDKAQKDPDLFGATVIANLPRAFFLLLPAFALLLKLFYWKQDRYYLDHLIFALYFHAFVFTAMTLRLPLTRSWMPHWIETPLVLLLWIWLFLYLPIALRNVYGGTWKKTVLKLVGLLYLYVVVFGVTATMLVLATLLWF